MKIEVVEQKSELSLATKKRATMENMMAIIDEGYGKIAGYLAELSKEASGAPYICYFNCTEDFSEFDLEMGFPVAEELPVKDGFYMGKTYEGKTLAGTHKGSYSKLEQAYAELMKYAAESNLELTGIYYDYYLNDPSVTPEEELLTKVVFAIK